MNIVHLDVYTTIMDGLSMDQLHDLGNLTIYNSTKPDQIIERSKNADILIVNKVILSKEIIEKLPNLKYICVSATGYNNIDIEYAASKDIPVSNVAGYSTNGVAQHVFAMLLSVLNKVDYYSNEVDNGKWVQAKDFTFYDHSIFELSNMTMGIFGFGTIGQKVGEIANAFGMKVIATHRHEKRDKKDWVEFVSFEELCKHSDVISLHTSLNESTEGIINNKSIQLMKKKAILINTARGGLINETDLAENLKNNTIGYACLDVLSSEPPSPDNPLLNIKNCIITPHIAWASYESRQKLIDGLYQNIQSFVAENKILNQVN